MNQHTKGPWKTRHGQSYTAICAGEKVVGYIDHFNEHDKRLVTSAPELLEALTRLEFAAQCRDNTLGDPCRLLEVKAELAEAAAQARATIAKAGGEV